MTESAIATFAAAFGLSLAYSLVPGPVAVEALRRGARRGVPAVMSVRLGALAASLAWAVVGLSGAAVAVQTPHCRLLLGAAGTALLLVLAARALRPARPVEGAEDGAGGRRGDVLAGALIGLSSPLGAAFWLGAGATILGNTSTTDRIATLGAFLAGFVVAHLFFTAVFATVVGWGRGVVGERLAPAANLLCVASLLWFALSPLVRSI